VDPHSLGRKHVFSQQRLPPGGCHTAPEAVRGLTASYLERTATGQRGGRGGPLPRVVAPPRASRLVAHPGQTLSAAADQPFKPLLLPGRNPRITRSSVMAELSGG
jgi:hypothetical protein